MDSYENSFQKYINITHKEINEKWETEKLKMFYEANAFRNMRHHYFESRKGGTSFFVASTKELTNKELTATIEKYAKRIYGK
ncbi:hypothetical protein CN918_31105 [Priestia megaterium]|nr:hypothetical protein CN918_31105 [Priestia megaterium]